MLGVYFIIAFIHIIAIGVFGNLMMLVLGLILLLNT